MILRVRRIFLLKLLRSPTGASVKVLDRFSFDPFGKPVDCNEHVSEAAFAGPQWSNHVQPPNSEGPDEWNGFQG